MFYLVLATGIVIFIVFQRSTIQLDHGVYLNSPKRVAHFQFIDNHGNFFSEEQLKNHWSLVFFGFSSCPMVCPLAMHTFNQTYKALKLSSLQIILISIDPEHDTVQRLDQFINRFNSQFIALRGDLSAVNTLRRQLHVKVSTTPMSHGTEILLINPKAEVQAYFYFPISAGDLVKDLERIILQKG